MNAAAGNRGDGGGCGEVQGVLFEAPPFSPTFPRRATLTGEALAMLLAGMALTHPDFQNITKSWRLSEMIRALRHDYGWPVQTIEIHAPTTERPDRFIARYVLPQWAREEAGCVHG